MVPRPGLTFGVEEAARQKTPEVIMVVAVLFRTPSGNVRKEILRSRPANSAVLADRRGDPLMPETAWCAE